MYSTARYCAYLHQVLALAVERGRGLVREHDAGSMMTARAMAMRCFCPPDSCTPRSPTSVSYLPTHAQSEAHTLIPVTGRVPIRPSGALHTVASALVIGLLTLPQTLTL